jgi:hypothetical protein
VRVCVCVCVHTHVARFSHIKLWPATAIQSCGPLQPYRALARYSHILVKHSSPHIHTLHHTQHTHTPIHSEPPLKNIKTNLSFDNCFAPFVPSLYAPNNSNKTFFSRILIHFFNAHYFGSPSITSLVCPIHFSHTYKKRLLKHYF